MSSDFNLSSTFTSIISGYSDGESATEVVLNRPIAQIGNNTLFVKNFAESLATRIAVLESSGVNTTALDLRYELKITKLSGFNLPLATQAEIDLGTVANKIAASNHNHDAKYEPKINKLSGFNKNFGNLANTVVEGNDPRLSDARNPLFHRHDLTHLNANGAIQYDTLGYDGLKWVPVSKEALAAILSPLIGGTGGSSTWDSITNKPTTLVGYGITTPYYTAAQTDAAIVTAINNITFPTVENGTVTSLPWNSITSKPTTVAGYAISDVYTKTQTNTAISTAISAIPAPSVSWSTITGKPITLAGFGITDAYTKAQTDTAISNAIANAPSGGQAVSTGIFVTKFVVASGQTTFTLPDSNAVFRVTLNGIDIESSSFSRTNAILTVSGAKISDVIIAYQQGAQAGLIRQEFLASSSGSNTFTLSNAGPIFSVSINGFDMESTAWSQSGSNLTVSNLKTGDRVITIRTRGF